MTANEKSPATAIQIAVSHMVRSIIGLATLVTCATAQAQPPNTTVQPRAIERMTVRAQRMKDWNYSARFVKSLLRPSYLMGSTLLDNQFPVWKKAICVRVNGMAESSATLIEQRIRDVAKQVGAPVEASQTCTPNVIIVVSDEPKMILDGLKSEKTILFASTSLRDLQIHYPVQVWYYNEDRDDRGQYWVDAPPDSLAAPVSMDTSNIHMASCTTHLYTCIQPEMKVAMIIADASAIKGMQLGAFADYITLLSLMQAPVTGQCQPAPSIANLLLPQCESQLHATALTNTDLALLTALYHTPDTPERMQQVRLINNMRINLEAVQ
jgi:hypothetical protein